jgi:biopolymer transport protein ExbB/TolQ
MRGVALAGDGERRLPDAEQIWMNARVLAIQAARRRALHPLMIAELIIRIAVTLGLTAGIAWLWYHFQSLAVNLQPLSLPLQNPLIATVAGLATALIALVFMRWVPPVLIEE